MMTFIHKIWLLVNANQSAEGMSLSTKDMSLSTKDMSQSIDKSKNRRATNSCERIDFFYV